MRRFILALLSLVTFLLPAPAQIASQPTYYVGGVNVGVLSDTLLLLEPFSIFMFGINQIVDVPPNVCPDGLNHGLCPDLTTVGLNGMDVNPNGAGHMPPDWAYNIFMLYNATDGACGMSPCLGAIITIATAISDVVLPPGWQLAHTSYRKIMYSAVVVNGELAPNHASNWPMPTFIFTQPVLVASFTTAQNYTPVDIARLAPDGGRFVRFRAVLTGSGNNLWLSPESNSLYEKMFAYNDFGVKSGLGIRVQYTYGHPSTSQVFVKFQPGVSGRVDLYVDEWDWTEVD